MSLDWHRAFAILLQRLPELAASPDIASFLEQQVGVGFGQSVSVHGRCNPSAALQDTLIT